jgi:hypothetical protein
VDKSTLIGVDFDNTVVCCDEVIHHVALEQGLITASVPARKSAVRAHLRVAGNEEVWTRLQGYVYGVAILDAPAYPGALEFFRRAAQTGRRVCIVSHRTRYPYLGPRYDLHRTALDWMEGNGLFNVDGGLVRERVFLEETKHDKLRRIGSLACTHFLDDLPELLSEPAFPPHVEPWLFDPHDIYVTSSAFRRVSCWHEFAKELLAA